MRKIILSNMVTLDGFYARPDDSIDWFVTDEDFFAFGVRQLEEVDTILFGRRTYESMKQYWPTELSVNDEPRIREKMNGLLKVVFTKTLDSGDWHNTRLAKGDIGGEIAALKAESGKDMVIFGSGEIVSALAERGLIDEYRLMFVPVAMGQGKPLFGALTHDVKLKLTGVERFRRGVVMMTYVPA